MFWGLVLEAGKRYAQHVQNAFHLSMATLEVLGTSAATTTLMVDVDSRSYALCNLSVKDGGQSQQGLDLNFESGEEVAFYTKGGQGKVHLTGYLIPDDSMEFGSSDEEDDEEEREALVAKKRKIEALNRALANSNSPKKGKDVFDDSDEEEDIDDSDDDSDDDSPSPPKKKAFEPKVANKQPATLVSSNTTGQALSKKAKKKNKGAKKTQPGQTTPTGQTAATPQSPNSEGKKKKKKKNKKKKDGASPNDESATTPVSQPPKPIGPKTISTPQPMTPSKKTLPGGVIVEEVKAGSGPEAKSGRMVAVSYVGKLKSNNKQFDASGNKGPGFKFRLGQGEVIKGWDIGVAGMKVGGKRRILCPPLMAYGKKGMPPAIPPNSTLVFDVELKAIN